MTNKPVDTLRAEDNERVRPVLASQMCMKGCFVLVWIFVVYLALPLFVLGFAWATGNWKWN